MTERQFELARHALGLPNIRRRSYRNHFYAGVEHDDYVEWMRMVADGYAIRRDPDTLTGGDYLFQLTRKGALEALTSKECLDSEDFPEVKP